MSGDTGSRSRPATRSLSRRWLLHRSALSGAGISGLIVAACGGGNKSTPSSQQSGSAAATTAGTQARQPGGEISMAQAGNPPTLDPHLSTAGNTTNLGRMIYSQVVEYVLSADPTDLTIAPSVASKWETPDGQAFTFTVRDDVRWQKIAPLNGRAVTADDVKYSFDRLRGNTPVKSLYDPIESITVVTPQTITFKLKEPYTPFLNIVGEPQTSWIVPREVVEKDGDLTKTIVGTGPFIFDSYSPGTSFSVKKNPDYFQPDLPLVDKVTRVIQADASALLAAFLSGQLATISVDPTTKPEAERRSGTRFVASSTDTTTGLMMRVTKPPFNDLRVRQAVVKAINQQRLIDTVFEGSGRLSGPIPPGLGGWAVDNAELKRLYAQDVPGAQKLLGDAGMSSGFASTIMVLSGLGQSTIDMAQLIQQDLAKVNIQVKVDIQDQAAGRERALKGDFDMYLSARTTALDPDLHVRENFQTGASRNWTGISDADLDRMIARQKVELNDGERKKLIQQIQRRYFELVPEIFLPVGDRIQAIRAEVRDLWPHTNSDRPVERTTWVAKS